MTTENCATQSTSFHCFVYFFPNTTLVTVFSNQFFKLNFAYRYDANCTRSAVYGAEAEFNYTQSDG